MLRFKIFNIFLLLFQNFRQKVVHKKVGTLA